MRKRLYHLKDMRAKLRIYEIRMIQLNPNSAIELCNEALKCNKTDAY